ncbi:MAG: hypothetical protein CL933_09445 [Deltaproteobacteria bacterium]|nr:hypothetical protein [Deltaproteobacteria bacterium]
MGPEAWLCVEQKVVLADSPSQAREIARAGLSIYIDVPHQQRNWSRMGFTDADYRDGGSDRLIDALVAWGDEKTIRDRIDAHFRAGATHVCLQPLLTAGGRVPGDELLESLAPR